MISKRDWRKFVRQLYMVERKIKQADYPVYSLTIHGNKIHTVDVDAEQIIACTDHKDVLKIYKHPDSFQSGTGLSKVRNSVSLTLTLHGKDVFSTLK